MNEKKTDNFLPLVLVLGLILLNQFTLYSQSKKKQIEILYFKIDSVNQKLTNDRKIHQDEINTLINKNKEQDIKRLSNQNIFNQLTLENKKSNSQLDDFKLESESIIKEIEKFRDSLIRLTEEEIKSHTNFKTVEIGNQTWMVENLNVATFRNGDPIPETRTNEEWEKAGKESKPAWCYYDNDPKNDAKYGKLYNWYAVNDPRGLAPSGWHVSKKNEWKEIENNLGEGSEWIAAWKLKTENMWITCNGSNETGFSALPGGYRDDKGEFKNEFDETGTLGYWGYWWNKEVVSTGEALHTVLNGGCGDGGYIGSSSGNKKLGMSVRCVKD